MIAIKRPPAPAFLADPAGKWYSETQRAIAHYAVPNQTADFEFNAYRDPRLKTELKKVFVKCAYCDYNYAPVYDGDVEHFRPKGRVREKIPQKPGYYWLANDWDNLLLSCQHCNQSRKQLLEGDTDPIARGKLDQFPVADPLRRACNPADPFDADEEVRYLLNPCRDNPAEHLAYEKEEAVRVPLSDKGTYSIDVYVLQRGELVAARKKSMLEIMHQIGVVEDALNQVNESDSKKNADWLVKQLKFLVDMGAPEKEFAGLARFFIRDFMQKNNLSRTKTPASVA
jgi:hypothetical protein